MASFGFIPSNLLLFSVTYEEDLVFFLPFCLIFPLETTQFGPMLYRENSRRWPELSCRGSSLVCRLSPLAHYALVLKRFVKEYPFDDVAHTCHLIRVPAVLTNSVFTSLA